MGTKPILFNTENVRALLEGRKTVTRRVVKPQPLDKPMVFNDVEEGINIVCHIAGKEVLYNYFPPYQPGDILWVRETWNCLPIPEPLRGTSKTYWYKADGAAPEDKWRSPYHMPREAARISLRVTDVRVERLQEIDDGGVVAEGLEIGCYFDELWNRTIKPKDRPLYGWEANPWVWVIEFERISKCGEDTEWALSR